MREIFLEAYLDQLRECLEHSSLSVTVNLDSVEKTDFGFSAVAEGFEESSVSL
jgi:hypothetical protein